MKLKNFNWSEIAMDRVKKTNQRYIAGLEYAKRLTKKHRQAKGQNEQKANDALKTMALRRDESLSIL